MGRYAKIKWNDVANGKGINISFWTQGCTHKCKGCHNPTTWNFNGGIEYDEQVAINIVKNLDVEGVERNLSILGGEPLDLESLKMTTHLVKYFKEHTENKEIWLWTGYKYEDIKDKEDYKEALKYIDVLIDGLYVEDEKDLRLMYRGSKNQNVIFLNKELNYSIERD